ncbi:restriction endonuclease subunit S [Microbacterium esteraromaticum]|uniref:restriction endonuclease subunit S n=1 Tax=Microbacterium esteraromaticum TaxID=57043 RepID=UPI001CD38E7F|nr:restriction endonuclease subunit S [Microbacterium esteraromaticum]MCA1305765.1 restriction endonuclease subunit S [Microbacterium esteraromaticum]
MSRIDDLIQELCPDGVERRPLGEFATLVRGNGMPKTDLVEEGVGAVHYGQIYTRYGVSATETFSFVSPEKAAKLAKVEPGDIIITNTSENIDDVGKALAWVGDAVIVTGGHATVIKHDQDSKFIAYWFASADFYAQKRKLATGTKVIDVSAKQLATVRIPVPPVEVQRAIVRVLDKFTQLEAELEAELEARRAQLAYYRGATLEDAGLTGQMVLLGDIAEFKYGFTDKAADTGTHRFLRITDINPQGKLSADGAKFVSPGDSASEYVVRPGDLLMARTGATYGKTMLVSSDAPAVFASFLIRIRFEDGQMLPAFYWHYAQSNAYWDQAHALVSTAGQPQFNANALKRVRVPMPSLENQASIVRTLDKFDALVNDISIGLPAELAARRKQYEYYRDRLLTFKELAS